MSKRRSDRSVTQERRRISDHQRAAKEQAIRWIESLDLIIEIEYEDIGGDEVTMRVTGTSR